MEAYTRACTSSAQRAQEKGKEKKKRKNTDTCPWRTRVALRLDTVGDERPPLGGGGGSGDDGGGGGAGSILNGTRRWSSSDAHAGCGY